MPVFEILLGSEQLRKWNINKKKKMTNSTKYIDC